MLLALSVAFIFAEAAAAQPYAFTSSAGSLLSMPERPPYDINPRAGIHEALTRSSFYCLQASHDRSLPEKCVLDILSRKEVPRVYSLEGAVRWPDDPTRQLNHWWSNLKFGLSFLRTDFAIRACPRLARQSADTVASIENGLLCNSHFGTMQFMHAQATRPNEPARVTYEKIMGWAEFTYAIASHAVSDGELDQLYCSIFTDGSEFHRAMLPSPEALPCRAQRYEAWSLTTLFTFRCSNPFWSGTCQANRRADRFQETRVTATGALLHLIQDSYSQSHCERGECGWTENGKVEARIECTPIRAFTTYRLQSRGRHTEADAVPHFAESCDRADRTIIDPITAGAQILWHIENRSPWNTVRPVLESVFGTPEMIESAGPSHAGECFTPGARPTRQQSSGLASWAAGPSLDRGN
jgi:hypothetical protein